MRRTLEKLPRETREAIHRVAFGGASKADVKLWVTPDDTDQAARNAIAIGLRLGRVL